MRMRIRAIQVVERDIDNHPAIHQVAQQELTGERLVRCRI